MSATVHLVDASLYIFRAWYARTPEITDTGGAPVNAVHGFTRFLLDLLERARPTHIAVAFDESLTTSFRNALYPAYKANRAPAPAELKCQFDDCKRIAMALGLTVMADPCYEADDLIGSALTALRAHGFRGVIVSADKDFGQLIGSDDEQWDPPRQRWNAAGVRARLGVDPVQVADYLALTGDAIDNIPGVPGIGAKTAAILLGHFGTLDALLARAEEVAFLRTRGAATAALRLRQHADHARLSRALTGIALDAPVPASAMEYCRRRPEAEEFETLFERLRLGPLTRARVRALAC
ncbi:MAG TPA: 5'-3' exonuclease H3TH domain-containing protein [Rhodanobacteraceae bacterium]|nr:5'-3' exonuclease H3TH domain-containing protein [Rhodanobacteraceae bacterium]